MLASMDGHPSAEPPHIARQPRSWAKVFLPVLSCIWAMAELASLKETMHAAISSTALLILPLMPCFCTTECLIQRWWSILAYIFLVKLDTVSLWCSFVHWWSQGSTMLLTWSLAVNPARSERRKTDGVKRELWGFRGVKWEDLFARQNRGLVRGI